LNGENDRSLQEKEKIIEFWNSDMISFQTECRRVFYCSIGSIDKRAWFQFETFNEALGSNFEIRC
jgi:hypothetical protein